MIVNIEQKDNTHTIYIYPLTYDQAFSFVDVNQTFTLETFFAEKRNGDVVSTKEVQFLNSFEKLKGYIKYYKNEVFLTELEFNIGSIKYYLHDQTILTIENMSEEYLRGFMKSLNFSPDQLELVIGNPYLFLLFDNNLKLAEKFKTLDNYLESNYE
jgi:hypothetical protein